MDSGGSPVSQGKASEWGWGKLQLQHSLTSMLSPVPKLGEVLKLHSLQRSGADTRPELQLILQATPWVWRERYPSTEFSHGRAAVGRGDRANGLGAQRAPLRNGILELTGRSRHTSAAAQLFPLEATPGLGFVLRRRLFLGPPGSR